MSCFWRHDWTEWVTYVWQGSVRKPLVDPQAHDITDTRQARRCKLCNIEEHRRVERADGSTYAEAVRLRGVGSNGQADPNGAAGVRPSGS